MDDLYYDEFDEAMPKIDQISDSCHAAMEVATEFMDEARNTLKCMASHHIEFGFLPKSPLWRFFLIFILLVWVLGGLIAWGAAAISDDDRPGMGGMRGVRTRAGKGGGWGMGGLQGLGDMLGRLGRRRGKKSGA